jgi:gliding motility-associated-like protein
MKIFTILLLCFASIGNIYAQNSALLANKKAPLTATPAVQTNYKFIQNHNQWDNQVLFRAAIPNGSLFVKQNAVLYSFLDPAATAHHHTSNTDEQTHHDSHENHEQETIKGHGVEVEFLGANNQSYISPIGESVENYNYFIGNNQSKWASNLKAYNQLEFHQLYDGIMMRYVTTENSLKYEFIVAPKANPNQIQLKYKGATHLSLDEEGNLQIGTSVLDFTEQKPYCYQIIGGEKVEVKSKFVLKDSTVTFELGEYNLAYELVIDPELVFCSYSGSNADNYGMTATFDNDGNLYAGGIAFGQNVPPTTGAFDITFGGAIDILLLKFNPTGTDLLYATFLGGTQGDNPNSLIVNSAGNLLVMANTSSTDFPTTNNAYDRTANGGVDIAVALLNPTGSQLLAATFIGGNLNEGIASNLNPKYGDEYRGEIDLDSQDNVYIASVTNSTNFPTINGGIGATALGGQDGIALRLSANLSTLQWSTYLGGSAHDIAYSIDVATNGNIVVAGTTQSSNFQTTSAAVMPTYLGNTDGYIRVYSPQGVMLASTFIGSTNNQIDHLYMMDIDLENNIYVIGNSMGNHRISPNTYNAPNGRHFLYKLNPLLTRTLWSTKIGSLTNATNADLSPTAFQVSNCGTIYLAGWGNNVNSFPTTPDGLYRTAPANTFYLAMYAKDCKSLLYATFFGGTSGFNHVDGGTSRFSRDGTVYHSMCIGNNTLPTTPTAWRRTKGVGAYNNAVFKMNINSLIADFTIVNAATNQPIPQPIMCFPVTIKLKNNSKGANNYLWNLGVFGSSTAFEPTLTLTQEGNYPFLLTINNVTCEISTSRNAIVTANPTVSNDTIICAGQPTQLQATGGVSYSWTPTTGLSNPNIANPIASPNTTTTYTVTITGMGCSRQRNVTLSVRPIGIANFTTLTNFCNGAVSFNNTSTNGGTYLWDFGNGQTSTAQHPTPVVYNNGTYTVRLTVTTPTSCPTTFTRTVTVNKFTPAVSQPITICRGNTAILSASGGLSYAWSPSTGLSSTTGSSVLALPTQTTTYTVRITSGTCVKDTSVTVTILPKYPADFSVSLENTPCISFPLVRITNLTPHQSTYFYTWTITGQPTVNTRERAAFRPTTAGTINISLRVANASSPSCDSILLKTISIPSPIPNTISPHVNQSPTQCTPNTPISLFASGGNTYRWTPTTGLSNPNIANPIATVAQTTTYTVRISNSISGCFKDTTTTITVVPVIIPSFTISVTNDCDALPLVTLNNTSIHQAGTTYFWDFGNGQTSTDQNPPPFRYAATGSYTIILITNNGTTCSRNTFGTANIISNPAGINANVSAGTTICMGENLQLEASGGTTYSWLPNTGLDNPNIANPIATPLTTTTYTVRVTQGSCFVDKTVTIAVAPKVLPDFDAVSSGGCGIGNLQVSLTNRTTHQTGTTYLWDFGNGQTSTDQNPIPIVYATAGSYMITLYTNLGSPCPQTLSKTVNVTAGSGTLNTTISPLQRICETASTPLLATGGTSYVWTPATGLSNPNIANPIANPTATTTYSVIISNGTCQKTETVTVEVNERPTATFAHTITEPCAAMPLVTITNNSVAGVGATYTWDFGNGQTSTDQNPAPFRYATAGNYTVTLTVRNANGCERTVNNNLTITAGNPIVSTISPLQRICETASTPLLATGGTSYVWTPATGLSDANIANPIANPTATTTYSVVISNGTCQKTETVTVEVNERPTATFAHTITEPCAAMPLVTITNNSFSGVGATYTWDFGNGQTSTDQNPAPFRYATAGNYTVTLTVRNANGCERSTQRTLLIEPNPILEARASGNMLLCIGTSTTLSASGGTSYTWTPTTGLSNPNIANPIANPSLTTTYTVRVSNAAGCFKDIPVTLTVFTKPTANFTARTVDSCSVFPSVILQNQSNNATSYLWDFGNGQTSSLPNPTVNYTQEGRYVIRLTAYNGQVCLDFTDRVIDIRKNQQILPTIQPFQAICAGDSVQLQVSGGTRYVWTPATGLSNPTIANPKASPNQTTTYQVQIFNAVNCRKDATLTVQVFPKITANFEVKLTESCTQFPLVSINNLSSESENMSYLWDFGNGQTSNLQNPEPFRYAAAGNYTITLNVRNSAVCVVVKTYQLNYKENANYNFANFLQVSPTQQLCLGDSVQLAVQGGNNLTYLWTPTTGLSNPTIANPKAAPTQSTLYKVLITNQLGCSKDTSIWVNVLSPVQADFDIALEESCDQVFPLVKITPRLRHGLVYVWDFGNGSTYTGETPPTFRYSQAGKYTIKLKGVNQACTTTTEKLLTIEANDVDFYKKITLQPTKPTICIGDDIKLTVTGGVKYEWTPSKGLSNTTIASPIASPDSTTLYKVRVFNAKGCFYDTSLLVTVVPPIKPIFELQISSECGQNATVQFTNLSTGEGDYRWLMGNGDILVGKSPKPYSYEQSGEYEIILEVFNGVCKQTSSQKIKAESVKPANVITPNNDGKNDKFVLDFVQSGWKLEVYNRYGSPVFTSDDYQNNWGHDNVADGTYYYLLTSPQGKTCKGWVQVLK